MNRRTFLECASALGITALSGCCDRETGKSVEKTQTVTSQSEPASSIVDTSKMTETSVEVTDGDEVSDLVARVGNGEMLVFPSGRFLWTNMSRVVGVKNWGIRCQDNTVFEIPAGWGDGTKQYLLDIVEGDNVFLENLTFDAPGRAAPGVKIATPTSAHVKGLHYRCNGPTSIQQHTNGLYPLATNESAVVHVDDYRQFNNGDLGGYGAGDTRVGVWVGWANKGTVRLVNPVVQGFPNNGCYVSRQPGTVAIEGGLLMNNNVSQARVSGNVEIDGTTVVIDTDSYLDGPGLIEGGKHNTRGFWGDTKNGSVSDGGEISNTSVILQNYEHLTALVLSGGNDKIKVEDTQFLLDADAVALLASRSDEIRAVNCTFVGPYLGSMAARGPVTGSRNNIADSVRPGSLPVAQRLAKFDWGRIHSLAWSKATFHTGTHTLRIRADSDVDRIVYAFTTTGMISAIGGPDDGQLIRRNDNGSWTAEASVAGGKTGDFVFDGRIKDWSASSNSGTYTVTIDDAQAYSPVGD